MLVKEDRSEGVGGEGVIFIDGALEPYFGSASTGDVGGRSEWGIITLDEEDTSEGVEQSVGLAYPQSPSTPRRSRFRIFWHNCFRALPRRSFIYIL